MTNCEQILKTLVSFPCFGGESNLPIIEWIKDYVERHGIIVNMVPNQEGNKSSLHCRIGPAVDGGIILSGHTDVVPVAGQDWTSDPFKLTDKGDGKLYARGSCDMKGFLACCLSQLPNMLEADLKKPIYFAFSYDEEVGCLSAPELIADLKDTYSETPRYALIGEPSLMMPTIGQKGICVYKTHVNGSAGHSSRVRQEVSAIHESAKLILWLENKMNALVASGSIDNRFDPPHTSLHSGVIEGGLAFNIIAEDAWFNWDVRNIPNDSIHDIAAEFKAYCDERMDSLRSIFPDFKIHTVEEHPPVPALDTDEHTSIVDLLKKINNVEKVDAVSYAAEAGQFHEAGFESVICGPGSIAQAHRANEFISKEQLVKGERMIQQLVIKNEGSAL